MGEPTDPEVAVGSYRLSFPVQLPQTPATVPRWNIWRLSLCTDRSYCSKPDDLSVLLSFPMSGFFPGDVSYLEQKRAEAVLETMKEARSRRFCPIAVWKSLGVPHDALSVPFPEQSLGSSPWMAAKYNNAQITRSVKLSLQ